MNYNKSMNEKIISILTEIRSEFDFSKSNNFIDEGLLDSFDIVSLVSSLDEYYNISIDGMDIVPENFVNVDSIKQLLIKKGISQ